MNKNKIFMYDILKKDEFINILIKMQANGYNYINNNELMEVDIPDAKSKAKKLTKCYTRGRLNK